MHRYGEDVVDIASWMVRITAVGIYMCLGEKSMRVGKV